MLFQEWQGAWGHCNSKPIKASSAQSKASTAEFSYDRSDLTGAKPWTSENFNNNPKIFHFAIIVDRKGLETAMFGAYDRAPGSEDAQQKKDSKAKEKK